MNPVLTLSENKKGRDLIVGDVHGMFALLKKCLKSINFNPSVDRLICCGDLVDRGPSSHMAKEWLEKEWFFSVMGNHDAQYAFHNKKFDSGYSLLCFPVDTWFLEFEPEEVDAIFLSLWQKLYPAIEIETSVGLVGIVHACVPYGLNWTKMKALLNNQDHNVLHKCMWDREIAKDAQNGVSQEYKRSLFINDIHHVFHGHTADKLSGYLPYHVANRYFIDTGAYLSADHPTAGLTICDARFPTHPLFMNDAAKKHMLEIRDENQDITP